jgi:hypothetical protein
MRTAAKSANKVQIMCVYPFYKRFFGCPRAADPTMGAPSLWLE